MQSGRPKRTLPERAGPILDALTDVGGLELSSRFASVKKGDLALSAERVFAGAYITEVRVLEGSKAENLSLREIEDRLADTDAQIIGIVQKDVRLIAANRAPSGGCCSCN